MMFDEAASHPRQYGASRRCSPVLPRSAPRGQTIIRIKTIQKAAPNIKHAIHTNRVKIGRGLVPITSVPLSIDPACPGRTFSFESDPVRLDPITGCILSSARVLVERFTDVLYSIAMAWLASRHSANNLPSMAGSFAVSRVQKSKAWVEN
ncbi:MAG: hypothetical protein WBX25_14130 [Rhodomicrobium sp.]